MIRTKLTTEDALAMVELGKMLHKESHYRDTPYNVERVWAVLEATVAHPDKYFIAFDDNYRGLLLLQMSQEFFSGEKWAGDLAFFVHPAARKFGLGDDLLEAGCMWARDNGAQEITIAHNTGIDLDTADQYYTERNFKLTGKIFSKSLVE
jgi:GNAT superfamily N-acetyltransferase